MKTAHLRSLTSLRFLAAMLVVLYHTAIQSSDDGTQPFAVLRFGYLGVTFFFVLSGFVLVWTAREDDLPLRFYRRRFARVWPLHALTFVLAVVLGAFSVIDHRGPFWSAPANLALLQAWFENKEITYGFNGVSWSLSDEAFFYAMFPLLMVVGRRAGARTLVILGGLWLVAGASLAEVAADGWWAETTPLYRVGEFVVGMGLAMAVRRRAPNVSVRWAVTALVASYGGAVVLNRLASGALAYRPWLVVLIVLPSIALLLLAFARRDLHERAGLLTRPVVVRLGQWSFALYMIHELLLRAARPVMVAEPLVIPLVVALSIALAGILFEWFEKPVERRLRGRSRPAVQLADR